MGYYEKSKEFYNYIIKNNGNSNMTMIWTISCVEESLQAYDMDLIITDEDKEEMCHLVLSGWLDTEYNIGISKIADIVVENWSELKDNDNASEIVGDYIADEIGF